MLVFSSGDDFSPLTTLREVSTAEQFEQICFNLSTLEDSIIEETEVVFISISSNDSAVNVSPVEPFISVSVLDNDSKSHSTLNTVLYFTHCNISTV